jgi:hypothetical protein
MPKKARPPKATAAEKARRSHAIVNPKAQRHTMTVASIHSSSTTVRIVHSPTKANPKTPPLTSLVNNDAATDQCSDAEDSHESFCHGNEVPGKEFSQTQVCSCSQAYLRVLLNEFHSMLSY